MTDPRVSLGPSLLPDAGDRTTDALDGVRPIIRLGQRLSPQAGTAVAVLYSLLSRLHPHTIIEGDAVTDSNPWGAATVAGLPGLLLTSRPTPTRQPDHDLIIGVGEDLGAAHLWLGGDDWTIRVGRSPQPIVPGRFGLGLQAGAVLIAAEVTKLTLAPLDMMHVSFGPGLVWNLLDHQLQPAPDLAVGQLTRLAVAWFGTGSVGSSAAGAAACIPELSGTADTVDPDSFDPSRNPHRYPASTGTETGPKAEWIAGMLRRAGWDARPYVKPVADWVISKPCPGFDGIAVSSVDRVDGRLQVADALGATTLSVGVDGMALHIQREHPNDEWACPYCQYVSLDPPMGQIDVIANQLGLPPARVARLYLDGEPLSAEDVAKAVAAQRVRPERIRELIGRRLDDLLRRAYAEASVPQPGAEPAAVSAPYVSWMGGVFVAAELVKAAIGLAMVDRRIDLDLSGVPLGVVRRRPRDATGNCVCSSPVRRRWAAKLYGEQYD